MAKLNPSDIYRDTLHGAASDGAMLIGKLVSTARPILQAREAACRDLRERDALVVSQKQLRAFEPELSKRYPSVLLKAFTHNDAGRTQSLRSLTQVSFEELELMDETEVQSSVALGRVQQLTLQAVEAVLAELNTLVCGAQGLGSVLAERNPLRPQVYIQALREVLEQTQVSTSVQVDWLSAMGPALGPELRKLYLRYCETLRGNGVMAAGYAVSTAQIGVGIGRGVAQDALESPSVGASAFPSGAIPASSAASPSPVAFARATDSRLLTLDRLHMLLTGELAHAPQALSDKERFAHQFSQEFERSGGQRQPVDAPVTDFDATVPAALEALKDMAQVQVVVQRLENRRNPAFVVSAADDLESVRACLRDTADGVVQSLGLEVVSLMVDEYCQRLALAAFRAKTGAQPRAGLAAAVAGGCAAVFQ